MSLREKQSTIKLTVQQLLSTPGAPESRLRAKKKAFPYADTLAGALWDSIQQFRIILPSTLTGKQKRAMRLQLLRRPIFIVLYCGDHSTSLFISPSSPVILFKFSAQLVFTAAKRPTKPAEFSEPAQMELLVSSSLCLLAHSGDPYTVYTV